MSRIPTLFLPLLLLSACAPATSGGWAHSQLPKAQWAEDYRDCRSLADRTVAPVYDGSVEGRTSDPMRQAERESLKRRMADIIDVCMSGRGYVRGKR
ncbi:MAG: hypothetical protein K2Q10_10115 [Rhodospirillales bacterium]|nr:hypothetical protein [Rhodospirillales bacterium]